MRYIIALLATIAAVLVSSPANAAEARTVRLEPPTRHVQHVAVTSARPGPGSTLVIRFNTGSKWRVVPCKWEDSRNCYWDARSRGNGHGRSFVTLKGKTYYSPKIRA